MSDDASTSIVSTFYHTDSVLGKAALHGKITIKTTFLEPFQLLEQLFETHLTQVSKPDNLVVFYRTVW